MGDAWMAVPTLIDLARTNKVKLIAGSYSLPVFDWAQRHIIGADWEIAGNIDDPDEPDHPYCPGKGFIAIQQALSDIQLCVPECVSVLETGDGYGRAHALTLRTELRMPGDHITIHPYTAHKWKNCAGVVRRVRYPAPVEVVGIPGEIVAIRGSRTITGFDAMCESVLAARLFVGVLSSWTNFACLFQRPQIMVSFTADLDLYVNPNAVKLMNPTATELEAAVREINIRRSFAA